MGRPKLAPTSTFPYYITRRLNTMSMPRKTFAEIEDMPTLTPRGVRVSALRAHLSDRLHDAAYPYVKRLIALKKMYKNKFSPERLERLERFTEMANTSIYAKLANCVIDLRKGDQRDTKKKRGWTESEWKKHMDYIGNIAGPKKIPEPPPVDRGESKPLAALLPRIQEIYTLPPFKMYRRLSKEEWYRDPTKVSPAAMKYVISERVKKLAEHKVVHEQ